MIRSRRVPTLLAAVVVCSATMSHAGTLYVGRSGGTNDIVTFDTTATNPTPTSLFSTYGYGAVEGADTSGDVYFSSGSAMAIEKITPSGVTSVFLPSLGVADGIGELVFDASGRAYGVDQTSLELIKFSPKGAFQGEFPIANYRGQGIAIDGSGNFYVIYLSRIEKYSPTGTDLGVFASTGLIGPWGMAFNASGNLFVADFSASAVEEVAPNGVVTVFATGLNQPHGLAFDSAGNLFVANTGGNNIVEITPSGVESVFAANIHAPFTISFAPSVIPEPSSLVQGCVALVSFGLFVFARRWLRCCAA